MNPDKYMNEDDELQNTANWLFKNKTISVVIATAYAHFYVLLFIASVFSYGLEFNVFPFLKTSDYYSMVFLNPHLLVVSGCALVSTILTVHTGSGVVRNIYIVCLCVLLFLGPMAGGLRMASDIKTTTEQVDVHTQSEILLEKSIIVRTNDILAVYDQRQSKVLIVPNSEVIKIEIYKGGDS